MIYGTLFELNADARRAVNMIMSGGAVLAATTLYCTREGGGVNHVPKGL